MITALGAEAIERAKFLALQADIIAALTVEVLKGNVSQFDNDIHIARPHNGQIEVASRLRSLLHSDCFGSECYLANTTDRKVQDPYTLRCIPQVHGIVVDTINFCKHIITTEMNSATDNPMVLRDRNILISGGNFHGYLNFLVFFSLVKSLIGFSQVDDKIFFLMNFRFIRRVSSQSLGLFGHRCA